MRQFYNRISELLEKNTIDFAICTVVDTQGSTPRHSGKMIVFPDGSSEFTIGGGPAEKATIDSAIAAIAERKSQMLEWVLNKGLTGGLNAECGGLMKIHIEVYPMQPQLVIVGAGHVNFALFQWAEGLNFETIVVDDRETILRDQRFKSAKAIYYDEFIDMAVQSAIPRLSPNSYVVIATKDADEAALRPFVNLSYPYIGVIGSRRKIGKIKEHLLEEGCDEAWLSHIHMPIGLDIGAETPEEIAISIWSEILMVKNKKNGSEKSKVSSHE